MPHERAPPGRSHGATFWLRSVQPQHRRDCCGDATVSRMWRKMRIKKAFYMQSSGFAERRRILNRRPNDRRHLFASIAAGTSGISITPVAATAKGIRSFRTPRVVDWLRATTRATGKNMRRHRCFRELASRSIPMLRHSLAWEISSLCRSPTAVY